MTVQTKVEAASIVGVLAKALPSLGAVHKNKKNPAFKSNYADLSAVLAALEPLAEHGLWFRQESRQSDKGVALETYYIHESGVELSAGVTEVPVNKSDAQAYGSAQSYCRRYALLTAFGLCADDDDGNAAAKSAPIPTEREIPDTEWTRLVQLIKATSSDTGKMLKHYKVDNLRLLDQGQYAEAVEALNKKFAKMAKDQTDSAALAKELQDANF